MTEYSINFDKIQLINLEKVGPDSYEGVIISYNESLQATMNIKPQTREWWLDLGKKIGGEFEKKVIIYIDGSN